MGFLGGPLSGQVLREVVTAGVLIIGVALAARVAVLFLDHFVARLTGRTTTTLDGLVIRAVRMPFFALIILVGVRLGLAQLTFLETTWVQVLEGLIFVGFVFVGYVLLARLIGEVLAWGTRSMAVEAAIDTQMVVFLRRLTQLVLMSIALIMVLGHFGFDISALVATLGVGSLAFALAARSFLEDTIAGFLIMIDRPFGVGDRIQLPQTVMGEYADWGDVAEVGVRSTRIRSTDGVLLTVPNSKLINDVVINFSHSESPNLRVRVRVGLQPDLENVRRAVEEIERIAVHDPDIAQEPRPPQVVVREIQEYDVLVELRFYVDDPRKMRTTKSRVIESMLASFEEKAIRTSTPMQVVQVIDGEQTGR